MQCLLLHTRTKWIWSRSIFVFPAISAIWTLLLYWRMIFNPFSSYDDMTLIVNNPGLSSWHGLAHYFVTHVSFVGDLRGSGESYYRPLYWVSLAVDRRLWGISPAPFHFTSLALHWLNGCLLFALLKKLRVPLQVAWCTVLLWLSMPINSEAVAWISARAYLLAAFFVLLNALLGQLFLERQRRIFLAGYALSAICALLCHEAGILLLPLTILIACTMKKLVARTALKLYGAATAAGALYFGIRHLVGTSSEYRQPATIAPFGIFFFKYLAWLVLPIHMSIERSTDTPLNRVSIQAAIAWIVLLAISCAVFLVRHRWPMIASAIACTAIALVPFCGLVPTYQGMAERFLYFASMGLAFLVATLCFSIPPPRRSVALGIVAACTLGGMWRLHQRLVDWSDSILLYQSSLKATPRSTKLLYNIGAVYEQRGDLAQADLSYRSVLVLQPGSEQAIAGMANIRLRWNDPKHAAELYQKALSINPRDVGTVTNYAASLQELGYLDKAAAEYRRAILLAPTNDDGYCGLGVVLFQEGDALGAVVQFLKAQKMNPLDPTPYYDLGTVYEKFGRVDVAVKSYKEALELKPDDPEAMGALLRLLRR